MDFRKVIHENVEKKNISQTFSSFMKFYFVHIVKVCFVLKKQALCLY